MLRIERLRPKLTFSNAIALIALFFSLGGTVYAAAKINGKTIKVGSIPANRVKADSLTGAQVNEASLGAVARAASARDAATALSADRATSAGRVDVAGSADSATEAGKAGVAAEAEQAEKADLATRAEDAQAFQGREDDVFQRRCEDGAARAAVFVEAVPEQPTAAGYNCAGSVEVMRVGARGEFAVRLTGLNGGKAFASAFGINSTAAVTGSGPAFTVRVFSSKTEALLPNEPFTLVVF